MGELFVETLLVDLIIFCEILSKVLNEWCFERWCIADLEFFTPITRLLHFIFRAQDESFDPTPDFGDGCSSDDEERKEEDQDHDRVSKDWRHQGDKRRCDQMTDPTSTILDRTLACSDGAIDQVHQTR